MTAAHLPRDGDDDQPPAHVAAWAERQAAAAPPLSDAVREHVRRGLLAGRTRSTPAA